MNGKSVKLKNKNYRKVLVTTVIGVKCDDGFVIGSDSQLSIGSRNKEIGYDKIYRVGNTLIAFSGDDNTFKRILDDINDKLNTQIDDFGELVKIFEDCLLYLYKRFPMTDDNYTEIIFGTAINGKVGFYRINTDDCFAIKINKYYPTGTGSVFAKYILKKFWDTGLKCIDAECILAYVINETITIDQPSGPPINLAQINNSGSIFFSGRDFIDGVIKSITKADKYFNRYFFKFITNPSSTEIAPNSVRTTDDKPEKI